MRPLQRWDHQQDPVVLMQLDHAPAKGAHLSLQAVGFSNQLDLIRQLVGCGLQDRVQNECQARCIIAELQIQGGLGMLGVQ